MDSPVAIGAIAGQLLINGLRFRILKTLRQPGEIKALSLEITHRCVCRCMMCNIWKIPNNVPELSISDWGKLLESGVFSGLVELDITGGEPFLVDDLPGFFGRLVQLKNNRLGRLRSVAITTNGVLTNKVLQSTAAILQTLKGSGIQLVLACAMDGVDEKHDRIRGLPGAFRKMQATLQGLLSLREQNPSLVLGIKSTILPENVGQIHAIAAFARQQDLFSIISPCIITGGRFLNRDLAPKLDFNTGQREAMLQFFADNDNGWTIHSHSVTRVLRGNPIRRKCGCGFHYAFVRSTGEVHLCPLLATSAGSVKTDKFESIWSSQKAKDIRGQVGCHETCHHCTEPGLERYSLVQEGWSLLTLLFTLGPGRFRQLYSHLGLQNYFG
jgi:MoaA/NifB/PqqE/SkfB family radical SAM enzyme